jgi:hypothetical protein
MYYTLDLMNWAFPIRIMWGDIFVIHIGPIIIRFGGPPE